MTNDIPFKIHNDPTLAADGWTDLLFVIGISCNFNQLYPVLLAFSGRPNNANRRVKVPIVLKIKSPL